ncbi:MAG: hypothetical protein Q9227_000591 [Pyrenula ochraceoflavens]
MSTILRTYNLSPSTPSSKFEKACLLQSSPDISPTPMNLGKKNQGSPGRVKQIGTKRAASTPPETLQDPLLRNINRGAPGDLPSIDTLQRNWERQQLSKKRSQYYTDSFAYRARTDCSKERVQKDSIIIAEIKVNCVLDEDVSLTSDLSFHLAQSYQRPDSCIMVSVQQSTPIIFAGNDEPAYLLTVTALSSEITPTKNKRITALTQDFLSEVIGIPSRRGVIRFVPIAEHDLATNGMTTLGEIEELSRQAVEDSRLFIRSLSKSKGPKSKTSFFDHGKPFGSTTGQLTPPTSRENSSTQKSTIRSATTGSRMRKRKSLLSFFR